MTALDTDAIARPDDSQHRRSLRRRVATLLTAHPLITVAALAALARLATIAAIVASTDDVVIPDERQYLALAHWLADGQDPSKFALGFGRSLLNLTPVFVRPLGWLTQIFGEPRLAGSLYSASYGVLTAVLTAWLALRVTKARFAIAAGAVVALLPSQILFSSVVLREALVWAACATVAVAVVLANRTNDPKRLLRAFALAALGLLWLGWLRDQVLLVAAWALVPAVAFAMRDGRWRRVAGALVLALAIPIVGGIGVGGYSLVHELLPQLGTVRTNLSLEADSAFTNTTLIAPGRTSTTERSGDGGTTTTRSDGGAVTTTSLPKGRSIVEGYEGELYSVDESAGASLKAAPKGLIAVLFRPLPWERTRSGEMRRAKAENVAWYGMYLLAAVGIVRLRRRMSVVGYPAVLAVGLVVSAAVTQGNLGTAFRHRGELLWIVAVFAAAGLESITSTVSRRRTSY